jgi:hypothetical protein
VKTGTKKSILFRLALSLWALATLVLCVVVAALAAEMIKTGRSPVTALTAPLPAGDTAGDAAPKTLKTAQLYFAAEDESGLAPEPASLEWGPRTVENCRRALTALVAGPRQPGLAAVFPEGTRVRGVYLLDGGELVVDFSNEISLGAMRQRSAAREALLTQAIATTLVQEALRGTDDQSLRAVRILIEGAPPLEQFPAHLDWSQPVLPDPGWVQAQMQ